MGFTEAIIKGKDKNIEEMEKLGLQRQHEYEDLEMLYSNMNDQKNALEDAQDYHKNTAEQANLNAHETHKQCTILEAKYNEQTQSNFDMNLEVIEIRKQMRQLKEEDMENLSNTIQTLSQNIAHLEMQAVAKAEQVEHARKLKNKEFEDLNMLVINERKETEKWKYRFQDEQKAYKEFQEKNMRDESELYDNQKRIAELEYEVLNNNSLTKLQGDAVAEWQLKFLNADERIKELERQVRATRLMRDKLE